MLFSSNISDDQDSSSGGRDQDEEMSKISPSRATSTVATATTTTANRATSSTSEKYPIDELNALAHQKPSAPALSPSDGAPLASMDGFSDVEDNDNDEYANKMLDDRDSNQSDKTHQTINENVTENASSNSGSLERQKDENGNGECDRDRENEKGGGIDSNDHEDDKICEDHKSLIKSMIDEPDANRFKEPPKKQISMDDRIVDCIYCAFTCCDCTIM